MDLRQLRYFVTVAEELHFGRAAQRLGMTQPPLSQAIQALEQELGVRLFERSRRAVALTPAGLQWLPHVRALLGEAALLPELARQLATGEVGALTLAFVSTADYGILPDLLRRYRQDNPSVTVALREATSDVQIEALLAEEIDAGIVIPPDAGLPATLGYLPLRREPLMVALPESWAPAGQERTGPVDLATVADLPLIIFPRRNAPTLHDAITGSYAARGLVPRLGQEAIQMQTIVSLVSAGLGVALVPESLRNLRRAGVSYRPLAGASPEIETGLIWRRQRVPPTLQHLLDIARA